MVPQPSMAGQPSIPARRLLEICVDSLESAQAAWNGGADRLEVCADLSQDGLTPTSALMSAIASQVDLPLHVMVRPRAGHFVSDAAEQEQMLRDIEFAKSAGAAGVVFGLLTPEHEIDRESCARLIEASRPLSVTFHRAFDACRDLEASFDTLLALGVERVLTSGGKDSVPEALDVLSRLIERGGDKLIVLPGGGVRSKDAARILLETGARELHASASLGTGRTDVEEVRRLAKALAQA